MWRKSYVIFLSLLLSCCSPPLAFSQSEIAPFDASWQSFDEIIASLNSEISNLQSAMATMQDSHAISTTKLKSWINDLGTQLAQREQELADYKGRLTRSESGAKATEALNAKLSKDLKQAQTRNWILGGAAVIATAAAGYFMFH